MIPWGQGKSSPLWSIIHHILSWDWPLGRLTQTETLSQTVDIQSKVPWHFPIFVWTSGQPVLRMECLRGRPSPSPMNRGNNLFLWKCKLTVDPLYIDCRLTPLNRGNCLFMRKWKLTVDPLCINRQPSPSPLPPRVNSVDCLCVDCWSSPGRLSIDPPTDFNFLIFNIRICWQHTWTPIVSISFVCLFCGPLTAPILDFVWWSPWVSKPGWFSHLYSYFFAWDETKHQIWCYTCLLHQ